MKKYFILIYGSTILILSIAATIMTLVTITIWDTERIVVLGIFGLITYSVSIGIIIMGISEVRKAKERPELSMDMKIIQYGDEVLFLDNNNIISHL